MAGEIEAPLSDVLKVASAVETRPDWDPMCSGGEMLHEERRWTEEDGGEGVYGKSELGRTGVGLGYKRKGVPIKKKNVSPYSIVLIII